MNLQQYVAILRARWRTALYVLAGVVGTVVLASLILPKTYTASAEILVDIKTPDPITGAVLAGMMMPSYMATQMDVIMSGRVARRVIEDLKLADDPAVREAWLKATDGKGQFEAWLAGGLRESLTVKPSRESNALTIAYKSSDAAYATKLANAFAEAYIETSVDLRTEPARQSNAFFDERGRQARDQLEAAQRRLSEYQARNGLIANDERFDVETQRLQELSSQLLALQAVAAESGGRSVQAASNTDQMQEVLANPVVSQLTTDLNRQRARLEELSSRLGDAHPQVQEVKASIAELRRRITAESGRVAGSVNVNNRVAQSRLAQVQQALNEQRAKVLRLKKQRDEAAVLEREVESARNAYQQIAQRLSQTGLESLTTQTNVTFLERASEPTSPSSPRVMLNTILAVLVGTGLAVAAVLVLELFDRRIRSAEDVLEALDVPVLGTLPSGIRATRPPTLALAGPGQRYVAGLPRK
jgi:polysaccharide biosynthesis transport protein